MMNLGLILTEVIICYTAIILLYKYYKIEGLYIYAIIATIVSCIICLKKIEIFGIAVPLGFGTTTSIIIVSNLITQKKGPKELKKYILIILITALIGGCFLNLSGLMTSSTYLENANNAFDSIFSNNSSIYLALALSFTITIWLGSNLYHSIRKLQNKIIVSNVFTIIIIEILENIIFMTIVYASEYSLIELIICQVFRYIIKMIIGVIGTIPIYILNKYD